MYLFLPIPGIVKLSINLSIQTVEIKIFMKISNMLPDLSSLPIILVAMGATPSRRHPTFVLCMTF